VKAAFAREEPHIEGAEEIESEQHDEDATDAADPAAVNEQQSTDRGRRRPEREEDEREADHEQERMNQCRLSRMLNVLQTQSGHEGDVARNEREHAR